MTTNVHLAHQAGIPLEIAWAQTRAVDDRALRKIGSALVDKVYAQPPSKVSPFITGARVAKACRKSKSAP